MTAWARQEEKAPENRQSQRKRDAEEADEFEVAPWMTR